MRGSKLSVIQLYHLSWVGQRGCPRPMALGEAGKEGNSLIRGRSEAEKCWECVSWSNVRETQPGVLLLGPAVLLPAVVRVMGFFKLRSRCKWLSWHLPQHRQVQKMETVHLWGHSEDGDGSEHCFSAFAWDGASSAHKTAHLLFFFFFPYILCCWGQILDMVWTVVFEEF